jgi:hypothetical protein
VTHVIVFIIPINNPNNNTLRRERVDDIKATIYFEKVGK